MKKSVLGAMAILANLMGFARQNKMEPADVLHRIPRRHRRRGGKRLGKQASPSLTKLLTVRRAATSGRLPAFDPWPTDGGRNAPWKGEHYRQTYMPGEQRVGRTKVRQTGRVFGQ